MVTKRVRQLAAQFKLDQRGITGLETAIVLVAFVLVASVFAYAVLNTGLFSADRSKQSVNAGLKQTESTMQAKGSVIAESAGGLVTKLHVTLTNAPGGDPISLKAGAWAITYNDGAQVVDVTGVTTLLWNIDVGTPTLDGAAGNRIMGPGDVVEFIVNLAGQSTPFTQPGANANVTLQIKPQVGSVVTVTRVIPSVLTPVMNLA